MSAAIATDETLIIETPERVPLHFALASIGNRFIACAIDHAIQIVVALDNNVDHLVLKWHILRNAELRVGLEVVVVVVHTVYAAVPRPVPPLLRRTDDQNPAPAPRGPQVTVG